jgi:hypothetical protein
MTRFVVKNEPAHSCCWEVGVFDTQQTWEGLPVKSESDKDKLYLICECTAEDGQKIADALNAQEPPIRKYP